MYVPPALEQEVRQWVANYHSVQELLDKLSEQTWEKLKLRGKRAILSRLLKYARKHYALDQGLAGVRDRRVAPVGSHICHAPRSLSYGFG